MQDVQEDITIIRAEDSAYKTNYKELWNYRDLISLFVRRNFVVQYKQTLLGPVWLIMSPLLTSIMYTFVFGQFVGIGTEGVPSFLFYMAGTNLWALFNTTVMNTSNTFVANSSVFGKVYFPRLTVPISQAITSLGNFFLQFIIFMLIMVGNLLLGGVPFYSFRMLLILPITLQSAFLGMAFGLIVTSFTTRYRDLAVAITFGMQLLMYATPVIYPLSVTGGWMRLLILCNPMTAPMHNYRYALFGTGELLLLNSVYSVAVTLALLFYGMALYNKVERTFMDTI